MLAVICHVANFGQTVEMWLHRSGYHPPNEMTAMHCRRRYRLMPPKVPNPSLPPPDPSLWIVHYSRSPQTDHIPANRIPILPQVQSIMGQRRFLQSHGQLARKDFMLHDRASWPNINFPTQSLGLNQPMAFYPNMIPGRHPGPFPSHPQFQGMAVPPGVGAAKVPRGHRGSAVAMNAAVADFALEDEDVSTGDLMDLLTPREVSKMRYQQHHEWMEEVFASPYSISQITPVSLGLGRKGELEALTAGIFDAPAAPAASVEPKHAPDASKLEPGKAEEFADRVTKKVSEMTAEIEELKKQHARRMERFNRTSAFKDAEIRLRDAAAEPSDTGSEIWRLENRVETPEEDGTPQMNYNEEKAKYKVDDVVRDLENTTGKKIVPEPKISCVQKGGLLEKIEPERKATDEGDVVMENADNQQVDEYGNLPQGALAGQSQVNTATPAGQTGVSQQGADLDVNMNLGGGGQTLNTAAGETGDWVMVNNDGNNNKETDKLTAPGDTTGLTPGNAGNAGDTVALDGANFDFTNIDTAGDALAAYSEQHDDLDLGDLDNSAFGDAFHATDNDHSHRHEPDEMS